MECLPEELLWNVLSRLAVKELLRCKSVCKSWSDIINDPRFINDHYVFYNNQVEEEEERLLLIHRPNYYTNLGFSKSDAIFSILSWNLDESKGLNSSEILNTKPYHIGGHWSKIMGPCNGIYYIESKPRLIMNPSLRQFMTLPPNSNYTAPHGTYSCSYFPNFGFDPKTNDYKVVVLKDLWLKEAGGRKNGCWSVELYSLNSNSWKKLDDDLPLAIEIHFSTTSDTYVNNCCHWLGYVNESGRMEKNIAEDVVLAFDMVGELFRKIKLPKLTYLFSSAEGYTYTTTKLIAFRESTTIGLIVYPEGLIGLCFCFQAWVMKDYTDEGSWIKQYNVRLGLGVIYRQFVGFYGSNQFLWKDDNGKLVLCEPQCEKEHIITRNLWNFRRRHSIRAARYMESLVSLTRGNTSSSNNV